VRELDDKILQEMQGQITPQNISTVPSILGELKNDVGKRLSSYSVLSYASILWKERPLIAELVSTEALQIIQIVEKRRHTFFCGKSEKRLLSGIFYFLGIRNKAAKTQRQIALGLSTSDVTVRISYRDWAANFPDLFPSVPKPSNKNHCQS
jgi:transcription initiation factor TFIIIB Brf1 subunit/transcription initiation factor TFIIB